jgi:hypothetical protein
MELELELKLVVAWVWVRERRKMGGWSNYIECEAGGGDDEEVRGQRLFADTYKVGILSGRLTSGEQTQRTSERRKGRLCAVKVRYTNSLIDVSQSKGCWTITHGHDEGRVKCKMGISLLHRLRLFVVLLVDWLGACDLLVCGGI